MNIYAVAKEMGERLEALPGLVASYVGPVKSVSVPCSVVGWPEQVDFLGTYGPNMHRITDWPVMILTGRIDDRNALERMGAYADHTGPRSVRAALEDEDQPYTACDSITVKNVEFDVVTWQGQDFQGAIFTIDAVGSGAPEED